MFCNGGKQQVKHLNNNNRGVQIIRSVDISATDMLIFTVLVIGTADQGEPIQVPI